MASRDILVRSGVVHVAASKPGFMCILAGAAQITALADEKQFVAVRDEAEAGVISLYFGRAAFGIDASLHTGLEVGVLRPAEPQCHSGCRQREVRHARFVGEYGINALRSSRRRSAHEQADEVEIE